MRTDSRHLAASAVAECRELIGSEFGADYLPDKPQAYSSSAQAQEAHEAIRPTAAARTPEKMRGMICNPIYTGINPFPASVTDEQWVRAAAQMIKKEGSEQFLVNLLYVLRESFGDVNG